jgi:hypothetical protein
LAGGLGRALLDRLVSFDWVRRAEHNRAVEVTEADIAASETLDIASALSTVQVW